MKKLFVTILILLSTTSLFASTDVYVREPTNNTIVDPRSVTLQSGTNTIGYTNTRLWDGSNYVDIQDNRIKVYTAPNVIGSFTSYNNANVSSSTILQLGTGYAYDLTIKAGPSNQNIIYLGASNLATSNVLTVGYPIATSQTVHFDIVNLSQLYVLTASDGIGKNQISYTGNIV